MDWESLIAEEHAKPYHKALRARLAQERDFCPPKHAIYRALKLCPFDAVKVVILGQDPYHGGQANGLAFAVNEGSPLPPSLQNIFKEIADEYGAQPASPTLEGWARQGVLLLNTVLTVRRHQALSHRDFGWQRFTDRVIEALGSDGRPRVFLLWGSQARAKRSLLKPPCLALESPHPSPLSAHYGFFGNGHFRKANEYLERHGLETVDWLNS
jgi:uracil-DNA glycosylase